MKSKQIIHIKKQIKNLTYRLDHCNTSDAEDILFQMIIHLQSMIEEVIRDMDSK